MSCGCEFDVDIYEPDEPSWHYHRLCKTCGLTWWSTHCPHDGVQRPCPSGHHNPPEPIPDEPNGVNNGTF